MTMYFQDWEFWCQCKRPECDALKTPHPDLVAQLNILRARVGRPIVIGSGLRCPYWNRIKGGVGDSAHVTGEAADLVCINSAARWELVDGIYRPSVLFTRVGIGRTFIHVDTATRLTQDVIWHYYPEPKP